jgi:hypothetical protein
MMRGQRWRFERVRLTMKARVSSPDSINRTLREQSSLTAKEYWANLYKRYIERSSGD